MISNNLDEGGLFVDDTNKVEYFAFTDQSFR